MAKMNFTPADKLIDDVWGKVGTALWRFSDLPGLSGQEPEIFCRGLGCDIGR